MIRKAIYLSLVLHVVSALFINQLYKRTIVNEALYEEAKYQIVVGRYPRINNPDLLNKVSSVTFGSRQAKNKMQVFLSTDCYYCKKFVNEYLQPLYQKYATMDSVRIELIYIGYLEGSTEQLNFINNLYDKSTVDERLEYVNNFDLENKDDKFSEDLLVVEGRIEQNRDLAYELGIYQFPTFILNNRIIKGLPSLPDFKNILDAELRYAAQ